MDKKTKQLVENEPRPIGKSKIEGLGEGVWRITIGLELTNDIDHDALLDGDLSINGRDAAGHLLEGEAL